MAEATIRDVARRAQVSIASVSRALNGLDVVSPETRERVLAAAAELGYVPHAGARGLSLARTHAVGAVLPDLHGEFFSELVRGMEREARRQGHVLLLSNLQDADPRSAPALLALRGRVDGLVLMAPQVGEDELARAVPGALPAVFVNCRSEAGERPALRLDNAAAAEAMVDHLVAGGRRRLLHIAGPAGNLDAVERADGFRRAVARHGIEGEVAPGGFDEASGEAAAARILSGENRADAVFAANDMSAIGCLQALKAGGLRVPEDVAVAGFDDVPLARYLALTTMHVDIAEMGARAVARLLDAVEGRPDGAGLERHRPTLVIRGSTAAPT